MRFVGQAYRAHDPKWSFLPISGAGAERRGGRFNPFGIPALYLSLTPISALLEASQGFSAKFHPYVLCSYAVDCDDIVDLSDIATQKAEDISGDDLASPWLSMLEVGEEPPQWKVCRGLLQRGVAGIITASYAPGAQGLDRNLVLWRWGPDLPHKIEVFDPSGRLPKNQLSWD